MINKGQIVLRPQLADIDRMVERLRQSPTFNEQVVIMTPERITEFSTSYKQLEELWAEELWVKGHQVIVEI